MSRKCAEEQDDTQQEQLTRQDIYDYNRLSASDVDPAHPDYWRLLKSLCIYRLTVFWDNAYLVEGGGVYSYNKWKDQENTSVDNAHGFFWYIYKLMRPHPEYLQYVSYPEKIHFNSFAFEPSDRTKSARKVY